MEGSDMAAITSSLERSFQNFSLNNHHQQTSTSTTAGDGADADAHGEGSTENRYPSLELNSETSLPYHWEQCLDLKTGEIYYINWRTGMKAKQDPRANGDYYNSDDGNSSCESDGSSSTSSESSPSSSREQWIGGNDNANQDNNCYHCPQKNDNNDDHNNNNISVGNVLVVGGCKSCLMYYMVPKQLEICPKCCGQLLHFDGSENASS